jgi:hypothetical protein
MIVFRSSATPVHGPSLWPLPWRGVAEGPGEVRPNQQTYSSAPLSEQLCPAPTIRRRRLFAFLDVESVGLIIREAQARQLQAQAQLRDLLMSLQGRSTSQAADIANAIRQEQLARAQLEAQSGYGLGEFFAGLGGLAGAGAQLGWKPFG